MRVAFASTTGETVDEHFGKAPRFYLWEIEADSAQCVGVVEVPERDGIEDSTVARADTLNGCVIVCSAQIGGPAAAKLVARHIHPLRTAAESVSELVDKLQRVLRVGPPPWLRGAATRTAKVD